MRLKNGVRIAGVRPEMVLALSIVESILGDHGVDCVVTSLVDGQHSRGSLHYVGCACDIRSRDMPQTHYDEIFEELKKALGEDFDLVDEGDHWHCEFQPKTGVNT